MRPPSIIEASAPARVDLAGGTLDLWPLHVLHPGSVTVNLAIDRRASCRVRRGKRGLRILAPERGFELEAGNASQLLEDPRTALVGSLLEALGIVEPLEIEFFSGVPFGSGLGGSSALTVALAGALERFGAARPASADPVDFVRDVETRVLGKPAGVQDYYPPLEGGLHRIVFEPGRTRSEREDADAEQWERHLTLFDTGASHSSGMNNWEIFRARLEGDPAVAARLEEVRRAAVAMAEASASRDFPAMGRALGEEWDARRRLAPVVSTPAIEKAISAAQRAGAWAGKACGAGGGGCVVFLSPAAKTDAVRRALSGLGVGAVLPVRAENQGRTVREISWGGKVWDPSSLRSSG
jgi:D-glycero-alpha-D-manno-heptose-7-phosphate kinase